MRGCSRVSGLPLTGHVPRGKMTVLFGLAPLICRGDKIHLFFQQCSTECLQWAPCWEASRMNQSAFTGTFLPKGDCPWRKTKQGRRTPRRARGKGEGVFRIFSKTGREGPANKVVRKQTMQRSDHAFQAGGF